MTTYLLDVNVLIALVDAAHVEHDRAHDWFSKVGAKGFATCPITENGLLRIIGHPKYPNSPGPPSAVAPALAAIRGLPNHEFWADSISIADERHVDLVSLSSHSRVTDGYLLALAQANKGKLATMDTRMASEVVARRRSALEVV